MAPTAPAITGTYVVTVSDAHLGVLDTSYSRNIIRAAQSIRWYRRSLQKFGFTSGGINADTMGNGHKHIWYDYSRKLPWFYPGDVWGYRNLGTWPAGLFATVSMRYTDLHLCDGCQEQLCLPGDTYCDMRPCCYYR